MTTTISYNNQTLATAKNGTKTLLTAGTYLEHDIIITDFTPTMHNVTITTSGAYNPTLVTYCYVYYDDASVNYYTQGDTFKVNSGETLHLCSQIPSTIFAQPLTITEDDLIIFTSSTYNQLIVYEYTLPNCDIEIDLSSSGRSIDITTIAPSAN